MFDAGALGGSLIPPFVTYHYLFRFVVVIVEEERERSRIGQQNRPFPPFFSLLSRQACIFLLYYLRPQGQLLHGPGISRGLINLSSPCWDKDGKTGVVFWGGEISTLTDADLHSLLQLG